MYLYLGMCTQVQVPEETRIIESPSTRVADGFTNGWWELKSFWKSTSAFKGWAISPAHTHLFE